MSRTTPVTRMLGIEHPIIQAPMARVSTASLAAAVSNAGGLGSFGAAYSTADDLRTAIRAIAAATNKPFQVNLFVPQAVAYDQARLARARAALAPLERALGLDADSGTPIAPGDPCDDHFAVALAERVAIVSFQFGVPPSNYIERAKAAGTTIVAAATTPTEARAAVKAGADLVIAQGAEAGGHQGSFVAEAEPALIGTMALVPQVVDAVQVPVIAAGGIMDGRGVAAALCLGAGAAQLGTAFILCPESAAAPAYRQALLAAAPEQARVTRAISGRPARGLVNRIIETVADGGAVLPFPHQMALSQRLARAALALGRSDFMTMWAGQGVGLARALPAGELMAKILAELEAAMAARERKG